MCVCLNDLRVEKAKVDGKRENEGKGKKNALAYYGNFCTTKKRFYVDVGNPLFSKAPA